MDALPLPRKYAASTAATATSASTAALTQRRRSGGRARRLTTLELEVPEIASSANPTSRAEWNLRAGSFSRQRRMIRSSPGDSCSLSVCNSGGSSFKMAFMVSMDDSPLKARCPLSISYKIPPKAKMSVRASTSLPRTCSGDI